MGGSHSSRFTSLKEGSRVIGASQSFPTGSEGSGKIPRVSKINLFDYLEAVTLPKPLVNDGDSAAKLTEENTRLRKLEEGKEKISPPEARAIPWKEVVTNSGKSAPHMQFQYFPPVVEEDEILVSPPPEVEEAGALSWSNCVVGYFLDKKLPFYAVDSIAHKLWDKFGLIEVVSNDRGFYFFKFNDAEAFRKLMDLGPWHFGGKLLILKKWEPNMSYEKEQMAKIPIWVQFYNIPLEFWNENGLSYIASAIGRPLYADSMTESGKRLSYARICVEIDVDSCFTNPIWLKCANGTRVQIEVKIPWKPVKCQTCRVFGHTDHQCHKEDNVVIPSRQNEQIWIAKRGDKEPEGNVGVSGQAPAILGPNLANKFAALDSSVLEPVLPDDAEFDMATTYVENTGDEGSKVVQFDVGLKLDDLILCKESSGLGQETSVVQIGPGLEQCNGKLSPQNIGEARDVVVPGEGIIDPSAAESNNEDGMIAKELVMDMGLVPTKPLIADIGAKGPQGRKKKGRQPKGK